VGGKAKLGPAAVMGLEREGGEMRGGWIAGACCASGGLRRSLDSRSLCVSEWWCAGGRGRKFSCVVWLLAAMGLNEWSVTSRCSDTSAGGCGCAAGGSKRKAEEERMEPGFVGVLGGLSAAPACRLWRMMDDMSAAGHDMSHK
jgi:hypothetical protein